MSEANSKFVLYLDIMGFKDRVKNTPIDDLKKDLLEFKNGNKKLRPLLEGPDGKGKTKNFMQMAQFSDSIVLVSEKDTKDDLNRISKAAVILMHKAFETGFAIRGAISLGNMVFDKENQLFFGDALVDAYLLEEELSFYGIVFHYTAEKKVKEALEANGTLPIENSYIKLKNGISRHYHVAWYKLKDDLSNGDISDKAIKWLEDLRETVSGNPRVYLDNTRSLIENSTEKNTPKQDNSND